jgi:hypothetical protein
MTAMALVFGTQGADAASVIHFTCEVEGQSSDRGFPLRLNLGDSNIVAELGPVGVRGLPQQPVILPTVTIRPVPIPPTPDGHPHRSGDAARFVYADPVQADGEMLSFWDLWVYSTESPLANFAPTIIYGDLTVRTSCSASRGGVEAHAQ